jgi:hypothetical protein
MSEVDAGDVAPAEMVAIRDREWWRKRGILSFYSLLALVGFALSVFAEKPQGGSLAMFISGVILMMASLLLWAGELFPAPEGGMPRANSLAHRLGLREGFSDEELRAMHRYNLRIAVQAIVIVVAVNDRRARDVDGRGLKVLDRRTHEHQMAGACVLRLARGHVRRHVGTEGKSAQHQRFT